ALRAAVSALRAAVRGLRAAVRGLREAVSRLRGTVSGQRGTPSGLRAPSSGLREAWSALRVASSGLPRVRAVLLDALGREVAVVYDGSCPAGMHRLQAEVSPLAPGAYFVRAVVEPEGGAARTLVRPLTVVR